MSTYTNTQSSAWDRSLLLRRSSTSNCVQNSRPVCRSVSMLLLANRSLRRDAKHPTRNKERPLSGRHMLSMLLITFCFTVLVRSSSLEMLLRRKIDSIFWVKDGKFSAYNQSKEFQSVNKKGYSS